MCFNVMGLHFDPMRIEGKQAVLNLTNGEKQGIKDLVNLILSGKVQLSMASCSSNN